MLSSRIMVFHFKKCYVCFCGARFDESMSLAVHCHYVGHKFNDHIIQGKNSTKDIQQTSQRKKILVAKSEVRSLEKYPKKNFKKKIHRKFFRFYVMAAHVLLNTKTYPCSLNTLSKPIYRPLQDHRASVIVR